MGGLAMRVRAYAVAHRAEWIYQIHRQQNPLPQQGAEDTEQGDTFRCEPINNSRDVLILAALTRAGPSPQEDLYGEHEHEADHGQHEYAERL